jgi:hypothetical protein
MSSFKQIEANRRNALKSTGPTTPHHRPLLTLDAEKAQSAQISAVMKVWA